MIGVILRPMMQMSISVVRPLMTANAPIKNAKADVTEMLIKNR